MKFFTYALTILAVWPTTLQVSAHLRKSHDDEQHVRRDKKHPVHAPPKHTPPTNARIIGGQEAPPGEYPWFVTANGCGGSLIHKDIVLSAAHCENAFKGSLGRDVWINALTLNEEFGDATNNGAVERTVVESSITPHPNYNSDTIANDYMVMKLSQPVNGITPIALDRTGDRLQQGNDFTVMGFGVYDQQNYLSAQNLLEVTVPYFDNCASAYGSEFNDAVMFCAGLPEGGKDSCQGDSGGPIVYKDGANYVQAGVVSWGYGCAQPNAPGVYAEVAGADEWIVQQICSLSAYANEYPACNGGGPSPGTPSPTPSPPGGGDCTDKTTNEGAWYDIDDPFFDCDWYSQGNNCANYGNHFANFGMTANEACCACGGGNQGSNGTPAPTPRPTPAPTPRPTPAPTPRPTPAPTPSPTPSGGGGGQCTDQPGWYDSDGPFFDCEWYAQGNNCEVYGHDFANFGSTASGACCVCGGGSTGGGSTGGGSGGTCQDTPNWHDAEGPQYNCQWYEVGANCIVYGDDFENDGQTANEACCACSQGTACIDDPDFALRGNTNRDCAWAGNRPNNRCGRTHWDGLLVSDHCPSACGTCA